MIAMVFPGQGSQIPGMGKELYDHVPASRSVFEAVHMATGVHIAALCFDADEDTLRLTQNAQLALYTCGLAAFEAIKPALPTEYVLAGHSVGEYAAVAAAGAVSYGQGAKLVRARGMLMATAGASRPGAMAAILGLDREPLQAICSQASTANEAVVIANDNSPGQLVISGDAAAVTRAGAMAVAAGAKRALPLRVSGAFHSPLMKRSAQKMGVELRAADWEDQKLPVYSNVTAKPVRNCEDWAALWERQLVEPVRWTETIQNMAEDGVSTLIECGPGEVLSGLARRIDSTLQTMRVGDFASLQACLQSLDSQVVGA